MNVFEFQLNLLFFLVLLFLLNLKNLQNNLFLNEEIMIKINFIKILLLKHHIIGK